MADLTSASKKVEMIAAQTCAAIKMPTTGKSINVKNKIAIS